MVAVGVKIPNRFSVRVCVIWAFLFDLSLVMCRCATPQELQQQPGTALQTQYTCTLNKRTDIYTLVHGRLRLVFDTCYR